jgi:hypothetical protein
MSQELPIETARIFEPLLKPSRYKGAWGGKRLRQIPLHGWSCSRALPTGSRAVLDACQKPEVERRAKVALRSTTIESIIGVILDDLLAKESSSKDSP